MSYSDEVIKQVGLAITKEVLNKLEELITRVEALEKRHHPVAPPPSTPYPMATLSQPQPTQVAEPVAQRAHDVVSDGRPNPHWTRRKYSQGDDVPRRPVPVYDGPGQVPTYPPSTVVAWKEGNRDFLLEPYNGKPGSERSGGVPARSLGLPIHYARDMRYNGWKEEQLDFFGRAIIGRGGWGRVGPSHKALLHAKSTVDFAKLLAWYHNQGQEWVEAKTILEWTEAEFRPSTPFRGLVCLSVFDAVELTGDRIYFYPPKDAPPHGTFRFASRLSHNFPKWTEDEIGDAPAEIRNHFIHRRPKDNV